MDVIVSTTAKVIVNGLDNKTASQLMQEDVLCHTLAVFLGLEIYNKPGLLVLMMASGNADKKTTGISLPSKTFCSTLESPFSLARMVALFGKPNGFRDIFVLQVQQTLNLVLI
ncbi:hypothetical protein RvY_10087 [Ramazzottius varieornatus]|uniref:Uncharacterized protein n=1 Tax=Ramazzottius varieornatus TaxID=947166 RepID=A0A1D1VGY6_RAMVA|nr:hypothetical protein RvY_10087 [Ramazzottius varieornatus]